VIHSPYRTLLDPLLNYIRRVLEENSDRLIAVVIPELVQPRWWEYLMHNQVATILKARLLLNGDQRVIVINTPWYLREDAKVESRGESAESNSSSNGHGGSLANAQGS
jgi:hypothetical protein